MDTNKKELNPSDLIVAGIIIGIICKLLGSSTDAAIISPILIIGIAVIERAILSKKDNG